MAGPSEILIIHPDAKVRSTLSFLLEDQGFRVRAGDRVPPRTATPPILAIVSLPQGESLQTAADVRHTYPEPKLIVLVKDPTVPQLIGLFSLVVARCFQEPVKIEAILASIRELLPEVAEEPDVIIPASPAPPGMGGSQSPMPQEPQAALPPAQNPHYTTVPFGRTSQATTPPMGRNFVRPGGPDSAPPRLFGIPEEDRFMDPVDRKLADFRGFRGPIAIVASDRVGAEKAAKKLARLASNRDAVVIEPVSLSSVRKNIAEAKPDVVYVVRSSDVIPPPDRDWLSQLVGQRDPTTPRIVLAFGPNPPEWVRVLNIAVIRLPMEPSQSGGTQPPSG